MKNYEWKVVNQWDRTKPEYHTKIEMIETPLSKSVCLYLLCHIEDTGGGYMRTNPVKTVDVTPEMLQSAERT